MAQKLPYHVSFTPTGQLMVSIDGTNYFYTKKKLNASSEQIYDLYLTDGKKPRKVSLEEASLIEKYFPNWRTRGFGKQE